MFNIHYQRLRLPGGRANINNINNEKALLMLLINARLRRHAFGRNDPLSLWPASPVGLRPPLTTVAPATDNNHND